MKNNNLSIISGMVLLFGVILLGLRMYFNALASQFDQSWYLIHCQGGIMCPFAPMPYKFLIQSITYAGIAVFLAGIGLSLFVIKIKIKSIQK